MNKKNKIKIAFFGCTNFSKELLDCLLKLDIEISAVFTIPEDFSISYSNDKVKNYNFASFESICSDYNIPIYTVDKEKGDVISIYYEVIDGLNLDVILVLGWYYMIPKKIRELAKLGAWGIHASMLPRYAGGAPLVWAMINGEEETGVTLFRMEDGVDDGDIISQRKISIRDEDTIREVYEKATLESKIILREVFDNIEKIIFKKQDKSKIEIYPQRSPEDGKIDINMDAKSMYDFIRAQSSPYPGAFLELKGGRLYIEKARLVRDEK